MKNERVALSLHKQRQQTVTSTQFPIPCSTMRQHKRLATLAGAGRVSSRRLNYSPSQKWKAPEEGTDRLVRHLALYGNYHSNPINKLIHFICVPLLMWSVLVWGTYLSELPPDVFSYNPSLSLIVIYALYYVSFDLAVSCSWLICQGLPLWMAATLFRIYTARAWLWALALHLWSWYLQLHLGHGIFEQRRPSFMQSLFQSVALAPLFVWYELLFVLGFCLDTKQRVTHYIQHRRHSSR